MRVDNFESSFYRATVYSLFGGRVYLEYERDYINTPENSFLLQLGGDHLVFKSLSLFGRTISFGLLPQFDLI